jgi:hypothetical protein
VLVWAAAAVIIDVTQVQSGVDAGPLPRTKRSMSDAATSQTPLRASFKIKLNGEPVAISTVGQAYRFITSLSTVEWMEFRSLHGDAKVALEAAAANAILSVRATDVLRKLFMRAKLL